MKIALLISGTVILVFGMGAATAVAIFKIMNNAIDKEMDIFRKD